MRDAQAQWDPTGKATVTTINFAGPTAGDAGFAAAFAAAFSYAGTSPLSFWSSPPGSSAPSYADCVRNTLDVAPLVWNVTTMHTITKLYEGHLLDSIDPPYRNLVFGDIVSHVANAFAANDFAQLQAAQTPLTGTFVKKSDLPPNGPQSLDRRGRVPAPHVLPDPARRARAQPARLQPAGHDDAPQAEALARSAVLLR